VGSLGKRQIYIFLLLYLAAAAAASLSSSFARACDALPLEACVLNTPQNVYIHVHINILNGVYVACCKFTLASDEYSLAC